MTLRGSFSTRALETMMGLNESPLHPHKKKKEREKSVECGGRIAPPRATHPPDNLGLGGDMTGTAPLE